jgi:translation initiation factor 2 beta subunit (eIF-2beta)/eIF-5
MPNQSEPWEQYEHDFLREVYPLREWTAKHIAEKLDRSVNAVMSQANKLQLKRPRHRLDYSAIRILRDQGVNSNQIAKKLAYTPESVRHALKSMAREVNHA